MANLCNSEYYVSCCLYLSVTVLMAYRLHLLRLLGDLELLDYLGLFDIGFRVGVGLCGSCYVSWHYHFRVMRVREELQSLKM